MNVLAGCLLSLFSLTAAATPLQMLTDDHPPLHYQQGEQMHGFGVDVVRALAARTGDPVVLRRVPFLRAMRETSEHADMAVFTVLRTAEREAKYQWVGPLLEVESGLYSSTRDMPRLTSLQDAARAGRITVPRKWLAYSYLKQQGLSNLYGVETPEQMMKLLRLGRTDLVVLDNLSLAALAEEVDMQAGQLHLQLPLMKQANYIAFSRQTDAAQVQRWQQALEAMKRDGQMATLEQRWLRPQLHLQQVQGR
ncbi:ABC transporter substrate-binding protein [Pseudomonas sp. SDI]|uniref:substrate-binding periplasmic protein n=1 Tax=Pseudomonas sp. SDI TaxID=2170734 RepID=UPI000DE6E40D|nr:transporter substrate-binding domain-containing protein [Pseudomonas sp. SDI]PWB29201.1 ABC transporter substrate-binding protein [Pseudomonas sp. SDI]